MTEPEVSYNTDKKYTAKSQSATTFFLGLSKEFNFTRLTVSARVKWQIDKKNSDKDLE